MKPSLGSVIVFMGIALATPISTYAASPANQSKTTRYAASIQSGTSENSQKQQLALKAQEQKQAVEEVNALILDSYKTMLDKVLNQLYANIAEASKGNVSVQVKALSKVRDDLDKQLDRLEEEKITPNRKKILQAVYFYLKTNVEEKMRELQGK